MKPIPSRRPGTGSHGTVAGPPVVTFTSDFGPGSPLVAAMKGVVLAGCPQAVLVDVSNEVPRFDVSAGGVLLFARTRHFARGAVHPAGVGPRGGGTPAGPVGGGGGGVLQRPANR